MSTPRSDAPPDAFGAAVEATERRHSARVEAAAPPALLDALRSLEEAESLDPAVSQLGKVVDAVVPDGPVEDLLTGRWQGHAAHPFLTDLPIGFWTSTSVLDIIGGRSGRKAADRLLALGLLSALPTVATGLAEWKGAGRPEQRVGVVHAAANSVGLALYSASYVARKRGRRVRGVAYALAGMGAATVGGYLGGHLAVARKVGTRDPTFAADA